MKRLQVEGGFGLEHLKLVELPDPEPGHGEVRIKMTAASLNYRDLATILYGGHRLPLVPLSDGCGIIEAVGPGVTRVKIGDRVITQFLQRWLSGEPNAEGLNSALGGSLDGCLTEKIVLNQDGVTLAPPSLTDLEAACLPCAGLTAWRGLQEGGLKAGDTVVVQGTGGVSIFALQFAKASGATVIITSSSDEKLERAKAMGADHLINYKTTPDWAKAVRKITGGLGADHVIEVGGAGTFIQSLNAIRIGGHVAVIGLLAGISPEIPVTLIFSKNAKISGISIGSREMTEHMNRAIEANGIKPVVDKVLPFTEARAALELMKGQGHFGKIALTF
jgi:NADPH:quinone reductase-like Zn-dependent oxidoreductase